MRSFEIANKLVDGKPVVYTTDKCLVDSYEPAFRDAKLPVYQTRHSAGADFFCAEEVVIPSIWKQFAKSTIYGVVGGSLGIRDDAEAIAPTLVHTGVKAQMEDDEVLKLYNRSSNPKKLGLVLANSVGIIDKDYYGNPDNDGEIMFAFYNFMPFDVKIKVGDRIGQGVFEKFLYPEQGLVIADADRTSGFGSTGGK